MICLKERGRASGFALPGSSWERGERGEKQGKSEAEPLEMRYQAEPGNEKRGILFECAQADFVCRASEFYSARSIP